MTHGARATKEQPMSDTLQEGEDQMDNQRRQLEYEASEVFDYGTRQRARERLTAMDAKEQPEHQVTKSGACVIPGCPCRGWSARESAKEVTEHKLPHSGMSGTCLRCFNDGREAERRNLHAANFDAGFATSDIEHTCQSSTEHRPAARGGGEEWRVQVAGSNVYILDQNGNAIANLHNERIAREIVEQREQHQSLVAERELLRRMLTTVIDAHYGINFYDIGSGDGIPEPQAKEIAEWWRLELCRLEQGYRQAHQKGPSA